MLTKIKIDNMQQQIDPMTGMPTASPQQPQQTQQPQQEQQFQKPQQIAVNTQQPQSLASEQGPFNVDSGPSKTSFQNQMGQQVFGGQSLSRDYGVNASQAPLYKMNPNYNGKPGVQQEDFEQF